MNRLHAPALRFLSRLHPPWPAATRRAILLVAVALASGWQAAAARTTILVLGDSLSAGYGIRQDAAWPALLERQLRKEGGDYSVANVSISGETTAGGLSRLPSALRAHRPTVVIIALGANDGLRGLPIDLMGRNLGRMADLAKSSGARTLLVGMRLPPNYGDYANEFAQAFAGIAASRKLAFLPFLLEGIADRPTMFQADGLHPTAAAQEQILATVRRGLAPLLRQAP